MESTGDKYIDAFSDRGCNPVKQNRSETIGALVLALSKAQKEFKPIKKTAINPFFKSKYAPLENIIDATKDGLHKNELAITQLANGNAVETILMHKTGEWISSSTPLYAKDNTAQGQGSAITYARRYALSAILNVASEEDDDGNQAQPKANRAPTPNATYVAKRITASESNTLQAAINTHVVDIDAFHKHYAIKHLHEMKQDDYLKALAGVRMKPSKDPASVV